MKELYLLNCKGWIKRNKNTILRFQFSTVILISFIFFIIQVLRTRGDILNTILFVDITDSFKDFYNSIYDVANRDPLDHGTIYPPLCYAIFYIFSRFIPEYYYDQNWYEFPGGKFVDWHQGAKLGLLLFLLLSILILIKILSVSIQGTRLGKELFIISIIFSYPFIFLLERGNILIISLVTALYFVLFYKSQNKWLRETAYLALAISSGIKIYPAILGILLLKMKDYKAAFRTVLYGVAFFFLPFIFFGGIMSGSPKLLKNIFHTSSVFTSNGYGGTVNFENIIEAYSDLFRISKNINITYVILIFILCFCIFTIKEQWKLVMVCVISMILLPAFSYVYTTALMTLPICLLFNKCEYTKLDIWYWILFDIFFMYLPLRNTNLMEIPSGVYPYTLSNFTQGTTLLLLLITCFIETIYLKVIMRFFQK